jgi:hypothetical protein
MSGRPSLIQQREAKQLIKAARQAGAKRVEFLIDRVPVVVHLDAPEEKVEATGDWVDAAE